MFGSGRIRVADAVIIEPETQKALVLFEVKEPSDDELAFAENAHILELLSASQALVGILVTSRGLHKLGGSPHRSLSLGALTSDAAEALRDDVKNAYAAWRSQVHRTEQRQRSRPPGSKSSSRPECERLLEETRTALTNDEKKKSLEGFVRFVLDRTKYLRVKYVDARTSSSEIDLIVENRGRSVHTLFDEFGRHFLVECKNWQDRVGAKEVRDFVGKLLKTKNRLGLLVTRNGVTGGNGGEDALREIQFCFDALNTAVLVLSEADLEAICSGVDLHLLLDAKLDRLRFDLQ